MGQRADLQRHKLSLVGLHFAAGKNAVRVEFPTQETLSGSVSKCNQDRRIISTRRE